jgi:hypothetical protein
MNVKFNVKTKIRFNGKEYAGMEAMPPDIRKIYEQALSKAQVRTSTKVVFNGQTYASLDEMPSELRSQYDQVMAMLDKDHNGIPDMLETNQSAAQAPTSDSSTLIEAAPFTNTPEPASENNGRGMAVILIGILILAVLIVLLIFIKVGLH